MEDKKHPIERLMLTAMDSIRDMIDVDTIIGDPIETQSGTTIIPISKVSFGFASGGSEFNSETINEYRKEDKDETIEYRLPFGGGSGAGVSINPIAFLVVEQEKVKLLPISHSSCMEKVIDYIPEAIDKLTEKIETYKLEKKENNCNKDIKEKIKPKKPYINKTPETTQEDLTYKKRKYPRIKQDELEKKVEEYYEDEYGYYEW